MEMYCRETWTKELSLGCNIMYKFYAEQKIYYYFFIMWDSKHLPLI